MENADKDENEKPLEASVVVENEITFEASVIGNDEEDAGKDVELVVEADAEKEEHEAVETSGEDEKFAEAIMDDAKAEEEEEAALKVLADEKKPETGTVEASSSGMKKPKALLAKKKVVKKVKKLVRKRIPKRTALQVAGEEKVSVEPNAKDSEPSLGEDDMESKEEFAEEAPAGGNVTEAEKATEASVEASQNALIVGNKQPRKLKQKTGLVEGTRRKRRRQGKQVLGSDKKQKKEVVVAAAADVTQQRSEEGKEEQMDGNGSPRIAGLIFMCNAKTRPDCFRFSVMGVQEKRKDYVMSIKPGMKLFLYDYDLKLLYGVFESSSAGGMKLERNAFGGSFPAQVRFKVVKDCLPLPESEFKKAIKENYNNKNKFKTELTRKQVFKLTKLFRPASLPSQLTHTLPIPVPGDGDRKRLEKNNRYAPGSSSRTHPTTRPTHTHERSRNPAAHASPPPRRAEPPRDDLFLSEREYRTYGLRRLEPSQHYPIPPPPDTSYRLPLDSYHSSSVDHERLLRRAEMERHHDHDRREVRLLRLPERDYHHHHPYDHLISRREIVARNSLEPPPPASSSVAALDSYRRDPYYRYEYRSPERAPRTYVASSGREEDDLYSRYVTADSLAEYYRSSSSRRFPRMAEPELFPPSSVTSRYGFSGSSLPYSHR